MEIHKNTKEKFNYNSSLESLFQAMKNGETIKEITLNVKIKGEDVIKNFVADNYFVGMQSNYHGTEYFDYVTGISESNIHAFYMDWIDSFTI